MKLIILRIEAWNLTHHLLIKDLVKGLCILQTILKLFNLFHLLKVFLFVPMFHRFKFKVKFLNLREKLSIFKDPFNFILFERVYLFLQLVDRNLIFFEWSLLLDFQIVDFKL
jgi:hypothetical protein